MRDDETPAEMSRRQALKTMAAAPVIASIAAEPSVLKFQRPDAGPVEPLVTFTAQAGSFTAIARRWPTGTTPAHCGRCPFGFCSLTDNTCLVLTPGFVSDDAAPDFRRSAPVPSK